MTDARTLSVGTHNLADRAKAQPLADVMGFNEVKAALLEPLREAGYKIDRSPVGSIAVAWDPKVIEVAGKPEWHLAHGGQAKLTPARGTLLLDFTHLATGAKGRALVAHFINGTEKRKPPMPHRQNLWNRHAAQVERLTREGREQGRDVVLLADTNVHRVDHPALSPLRDMQRGERTYDHVMHVGEWVPRQASRLKAKRGGSDHAPVVAHVRIDVPEKEPDMAYKRLPSNLPERLREAGFKVAASPGWQDRGRPPSTGGFDPVGVLCHHTATYRSTSDAAVVNLLVQGRPDLPGPLCQLGLARDGTVHVIAAGRANHAGTSKQSGTVAAGDGNSLYIGIEAFNDGRGETWPAVQYDTYVRLCAWLCSELTGNSAATVRGHKETSVTGKVDPTFDMSAFRGRVADAMKKPSKPAPSKPDPAARQKRLDKRLVERLTPAVRAARRAGRDSMTDRLKAMRDYVQGRKD